MPPPPDLVGAVLTEFAGSGRSAKPGPAVAAPAPGRASAQLVALDALVGVVAVLAVAVADPAAGSPLFVGGRWRTNAKSRTISATKATAPMPLSAAARGIRIDCCSLRESRFWMPRQVRARKSGAGWRWIAAAVRAN